MKLSSKIIENNLPYLYDNRRLTSFSKQRKPNIIKSICKKHSSEIVKWLISEGSVEGYFYKHIGYDPDMNPVYNITDKFVEAIRKFDSGM